MIIRRFTELLLPTDTTPLPGSLISSLVKAALVLSFVSLYSTAEFKPKATEYLDPVTLALEPNATAPVDSAVVRSSTCLANTWAPRPMATALVAVVTFVVAPNATEPVPSITVSRPMAIPSFTFAPSLVTLPVVGSTVFTTPTRAFGPNAKECAPLTLAFVPSAKAFQ